MIEKETLLQLLKDARRSERTVITGDQISRAYAVRQSPAGRANYFPVHRKSTVTQTVSSRHEEHLAKELLKFESLLLPNGNLLRFLYYQCPLKSVRTDKGVGKIDLIGCIDEKSLALIELKTEESTENPRIALLEIMTYGAIINDNLKGIQSQIKTVFGCTLDDRVQLIILAPQTYWDRWREKRRFARWKQFSELCSALRSEPVKVDIRCLAFKFHTAATEISLC